MDQEYTDWDISMNKKERENHESLQLRLSVRDKIRGLAMLCHLENTTDKKLASIMSDIQQELPKHPDQKAYYDVIVTSYPRLDKLRKELDDKYQGNKQ